MGTAESGLGTQPYTGNDYKSSNIMNELTVGTTPFTNQREVTAPLMMSYKDKMRRSQ